MKDKHVLLRLTSMAFMENDTLAALQVHLRRTQRVLRTVPLLHRRDRRQGRAALAHAAAMIAFVEQVVRAANVALSIARGEHEVAEWYAENELSRPRSIPKSEWLSVIFSIISELRWISSSVLHIPRYIAGAGINVYKREYAYGGTPRRSDALYHSPEESREVIGLGVLAQMPAQAVMVRQFTERSVAELQQAAAKQAELAQYIAAVVKQPNRDRRDLWRELGWTEAKGKRIDRRFRRLRARVRSGSAGMEWLVMPPPGISHASCTSYLEPLHNGTHGMGIGTWQHRSICKLWGSETMNSCCLSKVPSAEH